MPRPVNTNQEQTRQKKKAPETEFRKPFSSSLATDRESLSRIAVKSFYAILSSFRRAGFLCPAEAKTCSHTLQRRLLGGDR